MAFDYFGYVILPLLIFGSRILDVSIGTIRILFVSRGLKNIAPILGFFEVLIWIIAAKQVMGGMDNAILYFAYAGGYAMGTYVGMVIEKKLNVGKVIVRFILPEKDIGFIHELMKKYKITIAPGVGKIGRVHIAFAIIEKKRLKGLIDEIEKFNPNAFYTIEGVHHVNSKDYSIKKKTQLFKYRKGK